MQLLYLTEPGSFVSLKGNQLIVRKDRDAVISAIGIEKIEGIVLLGPCNLSTGLAVELLERNIPVTWLSSSGSFFGRLEPVTGYNINRQIQQFEMHNDTEFRIELSKRWIQGKIDNCRGVLRRFNRRRELDMVEKSIETLQLYREKIERCGSIEEIMGFEGISSKTYFGSLSTLLPEPFRFQSRSKRPPRDPFNSLLSFGYTLLLYEIFTALTNKNLHPYLGFMHQPRQGHPSLASDLMEEWRPLIIDSLALSLVTGQQLKNSDFLPAAENGGVYLNREASKEFITKFEKKLRSENQYLSYVDYPLTFRESIIFQVGTLVKCIELKDATLYRPVIAR